MAYSWTNICNAFKNKLFKSKDGRFKTHNEYVKYHLLQVYERILEVAQEVLDEGFADPQYVDKMFETHPDFHPCWVRDQLAALYTDVYFHRSKLQKMKSTDLTGYRYYLLYEHVNQTAFSLGRMIMCVIRHPKVQQAYQEEQPSLVNRYNQLILRLAEAVRTTEGIYNRKQRFCYRVFNVFKVMRAQLKFIILTTSGTIDPLKKMKPVFYEAVRIPALSWRRPNPEWKVIV
ncbi:hypothetical protein SJAG_01871 [Schizosaccharomyces japonicus yFS275]|uniref:Uncharacterized protein n=1 Tax=Schizosaccharomyces japonicus (strain yFS275 / FY16936) TaxID=402676 RepID=B6JZ47_SCHJY|nr:hypothetical protein SJAG_01871 [Schizosaccharomyces japonicus yFS275]EEB06815.1 hypothetical protein SJAG_01871 [Schizosaccharomyces japonicus yFS275]